MSTALENTVFLTVECKEPEGTFQREVKLCQLSKAKLRYLYDKLKQFDVLFDKGIVDSDSFIQSFVVINNDGTIEPVGIIVEVDDVGIIRFTEIEPNVSANIHVTFWDRRFRGREELVRQVLAYAMEIFNLHRISAQVPLYANPLLGAIERVGFKKEGRLREATLFRGKWFDVNQYSVLRGEV